jgi:hypothetical protein
VRRVTTAFVTASVLAVLTGVALPAKVDMTGGDVFLALSAATPGRGPDPVIDFQSGLRFKLSASDPTMKITVETNLGNPRFSLTVEAVNETHGTSQGKVELGTVARDLLGDVTSAKNQTCELRYEATALVADGTGSDAHTITYTIVPQ